MLSRMVGRDHILSNSIRIHFRHELDLLSADKSHFHIHAEMTVPHPTQLELSAHTPSSFTIPPAKAIVRYHKLSGMWLAGFSFSSHQ